jgi:hypothetical protein
MAPEPISTAYLINTSHQSVCLCVLLLLLSNGSVLRYRGNEYTRKNSNVRGVIIYVLLVVSKERRRLSLTRTPFLFVFLYIFELRDPSAHKILITTYSQLVVSLATCGSPVGFERPASTRIHLYSRNCALTLSPSLK